MPTDPRWITFRNSLKSDLGLMSKKNGYHFDYGEVTAGTASFADEPDYDRPTPFLKWDGPAQGDPRGDEQATSRSRHDEQFMVSVAIKASDGDHEGKAARVRADVHQALMASGRRGRGMSRVNTWDARAEWIDGAEAVQTGGVLALIYVVRWDHVTGDMTTQ